MLGAVADCVVLGPVAVEWVDNAIVTTTIITARMKAPSANAAR